MIFRRLLTRARKEQIDFNPGEFEVLRTRASRGWWEQGVLVITNHRLFWFPMAGSQRPTVELDFRRVLGCVEVRSWYYMLMRPALKVLLTTGKSEEFHAILDHEKARFNIDRFAGQERYVPGTLFK